MPTRISAHLALFAVALFYAGNYLIAKTVMNGDFLEPLGFVLLRVSSATLLFWLASLFVKSKRIERRDWPVFVLCGLTGVAANQSLFFSGLELTTPVHASLIMTTNPILVLVFAYFILRDKVTWRKVLGIAIGFAGALFLVAAGQQVVEADEYMLGDTMIFLNATSYALYLVVVKRLIAKYPPLTVIKWVFTIGLFFVIPLGFSQLTHTNWELFTMNAWLGVVYVIICVTFLAYLLNIYALQRVTPSTVAFYIYLQPLLASLLSVMFGMDTLNLTTVISGLLIFTGVFLVSDIGLKSQLSSKA